MKQMSVFQKEKRETEFLTDSDNSEIFINLKKDN